MQIPFRDSARFYAASLKSHICGQDEVIQNGPRDFTGDIAGVLSLTVFSWYFWDHDDVIKWKHFLRYWTFVWGIHRSPVNSLHKGQWSGALMLSLICAWINGLANNREAGDLRRHRAHYDVIVMISDVFIRPWTRSLLFYVMACRTFDGSQFMYQCRLLVHCSLKEGLQRYLDQNTEFLLPRMQNVWHFVWVWICYEHSIC